MQRKALETAAASYSYLRGLLLIPVGLALILAALGNWQAGPFRHAWAFVIALVLLATACLPITRFYTDHYGQMHPATQQQWRDGLAAAIAVPAMIVMSVLLRSHAPWSLDLPVNPIAVSFAVLMLVSYGIGLGVTAHHTIIWGTLLLIGAVPIWRGPDPSNIGLVLAGVAVILSGIFDHRLFLATFGQPTALDAGGGDV